MRQGIKIMDGGKARYASETEILEAAARIMKERIKSGRQITSPMDAVDYYRYAIGTKKHEEFHIIFMDNRHTVLDMELHSKGTINTNTIYTRELIGRIIQIGANAVIVVHNHPTGNPEPSQGDYQITETIKKALDVIHCTLVDHLIIGNPEYYSFAEHGEL